MVESLVLSHAKIFFLVALFFVALRNRSLLTFILKELFEYGFYNIISLTATRKIIVHV